MVKRNKRKKYINYIDSPQWQEIREAYWTSQLPQNCYICRMPRQRGFHLHHLTYERFGAELLSDLVPVCSDCHRTIHAVHKLRPTETIREVTEFVRTEFSKHLPTVELTKEEKLLVWQMRPYEGTLPAKPDLGERKRSTSPGKWRPSIQ